eukprot:222811-Rhodomonas_salina.2
MQCSSIVATVLPGRGAMSEIECSRERAIDGKVRGSLRGCVIDGADIDGRVCNRSEDARPVKRSVQSE